MGSGSKHYSIKLLELSWEKNNENIFFKKRLQISSGFPLEVYKLAPI
tara:strand:- start:183 stop:323 length:141 start_codon:yes stop_codon:yes gene_type:complete